MKYMQTLAAVALAGSVALTAPEAAAAQEQIPPQQEQQTIEVTDELLERFVAVYPAVVNVAQAVQTELAGVETAAEAQEIQTQAQARISELLDEGDMTVPEYEAVVMRLNNDAELRSEFEERLAEVEGDGTDG